MSVIVERPPVPIRQRNPSIPARLAELIDTALIEEPRITFSTARAFLDALDAVLGKEREDAAPRIRVSTWYLQLTPAADMLVVGQRTIVTLALHAAFSPGSVPLRIPHTALELTLFIEAPGFFLDQHTRTIAVLDGQPAERVVTFNLLAIASGNPTVNVTVYPDSRIEGLTPAKLPLDLRVDSLQPLADVRNLLGPHTIADPAPDVVLYSLLEEIPGGRQQVAFHLESPTLGIDRKRLEPPLHLDAADLDGIRSLVASRLAGLSGRPAHILAALQATGEWLFDRLMPPGHPLRDLYCGPLANLSVNRPATWLIVADPQTLLPWECVCSSGIDEHGQPWIDELLGARFSVSHHVGRRGLPLISEAPLGRIDLAHYGQPPAVLGLWQNALGGPGRTDLAAWDGPLLLALPGSPHFGLHVLRSVEAMRPGQVRAYQDEPAQKDDPESRLHDDRLDFSRKRPLAGVSLIDDLPAWQVRPSSDRGGVEADWVLPLLHAGAAGVVGTRWPVAGECDRLFLRTFHAALCAGEPLGLAAWRARGRVRSAFLGRSDWLAFTCFGHPECVLYEAEPTEGFAVFEAVAHPADQPFQAGRTYRFRASYRANAPVWYQGPLGPFSGANVAPENDIAVRVLPFAPGLSPVHLPLALVPGSPDRVATIDLTMPEDASELPILVRFERAGKEVRRLELSLEIEP